MAGEYEKALKSGKLYVTTKQLKGEYPYLTVLDDILKDKEDTSEAPLGLVQIPLDQVVGTVTAGRSQAFAGNFMPILPEKTEMSSKWQSLCNSHLEEGIRDPITAYEYMNRFYVMEGNKRVSVLKFFGAVSVTGNVTRIIPKRTEEKENKIYYEFLDFYKASRINFLWFGEEGNFEKLQSLVGKEPDETWTDDERTEFHYIYEVFEKAYRKMESRASWEEMCDALVDFIELYGYQEVKEMNGVDLEKKISNSKKVFVALSEETPQISMEPEEEPKPKLPLLQKMIQPLAVLNADPINRIAFVHEVSPKKSGFTYAHDLGRMHVEQVFCREAEFEVFIASEYESPEAAIEAAIEEGNTLIFTTSPVLYNASVKVALDHPQVRILNCSLWPDKGVIRTYSARMYEAKFLIGAIAGGLTENDRLGYVADYPIYGTVASVNAFALGAKMINPRVKVYVEWTSRKRADIRRTFSDNDVSFVSGRDIIIPDKDEGARHFGLYRREDDVKNNLAMPVWNWGKFYEQAIRNFMDGSWKKNMESGKSVNYWWGMSTGLVDVITSQNLPIGTTRLVKLLKSVISKGDFNPFAGIIYSQTGIIQGDEDEIMAPERIVTMDWLAENVIGSIPKMSDLEEKAKPVVQQQGVETVEEE
ncbi:MAG: BMP family ABC transporter substrate-binding protein [Lachnospiraceae bacterium]|nr:BMP family ABC transporter substrate-binding protein [Lachnospiraceae bacterium]